MRSSSTTPSATACTIAFFTSYTCSILYSPIWLASKNHINTCFYSFNSRLCQPIRFDNRPHLHIIGNNDPIKTHLISEEPRHNIMRQSCRSSVFVEFPIDNMRGNNRIVIAFLDKFLIRQKLFRTSVCLRDIGNTEMCIARSTSVSGKVFQRRYHLPFSDVP